MPKDLQAANRYRREVLSAPIPDAILRSVVPVISNRDHSLLVKATYFCGYFLLIFAAGTVGSAVFITHQLNVAKEKWPQATGHIRHCFIGSFDSRIGLSKSYGLLCGITYQLAGRTYRSSFSTKWTRSLRLRSELTDWIARNREGDVTIRIDPTYPDRIFVQSPLPIHQGADPDDFLYAAIVMAIAGLSLTAIGRRLVRTGW